MKNLIKICGLTSFVALSSLWNIDAVSAFTVTFNNPGFEDSYNSWSTTGDTTVQSTFQTISPTAGTSQALITTGCHNCPDDNNPGSLRNDDLGTSISTFNYSDINPVSSTVDTPTLQNTLNLDADALSIFVEDGDTVYNTFERTPKEGSGILSDTFTVSDSFTLSFNWNYLTNDGAGDLGDQDFGFVTIYSVDGSGEPVIFYAGNDNYSQIDVLADSTGSIPTPSSNNFENVNGYETYTSGLIPAGNYRVGYGVVDVDGVDRTSALLVDNILIQEVPFEFSPSLGLLLVAGVIATISLRQKLANSNLFELKAFDFLKVK